MSDPEPGRVECFSGHTYAQEPRAVHWRQDRYRVTSIEARWRTPEGPGFRVLCQGEVQFELLYEERPGRWLVRRL
jgi:hypothetical protein